MTCTRESPAKYGAALNRLARAYEADPDKRRDLLQEIHIALWRSLARFDRRCSVRTWVYRVAHNTAISQVIRRRESAPALVSLGDVAPIRDTRDGERVLDERRVLERLLVLIRSLEPIDRQVMLLHLEGLDAAAIAEITGLSGSNVATKVHRLKRTLVKRFYEDRHGARTF